MEVFPACSVIVIGLFSLVFINLGYVDGSCSPNCLEASGNDTGIICNETTQECLYGCQDGYGGERCQFKCANNCSNCTVVECTGNCNDTCDNSTCNQNETCIEGCTGGFYGQNCSLPCPKHCLNSTCGRTNGTCVIGCEEEFFGDMCEKNYADANCSPTCLEATENTPGFACNETTLECLYGCQQGYGGERCQFRCADNCPNCTGEGCNGDCNGTCNNITCYQNETCIQGCLNAFYGQNCSLPCPGRCSNSTCDRENGKCLLCEEDFFGDKCEKTCSTYCKEAPVNEMGFLCNVTTLGCLYGCKEHFEGNQCDTCIQGRTGDQCQLECVDYNCLNCTLDASAGCDVCYPNYYPEQKECEECRSQCLRNINSTLPACDQSNGECTFGCMGGWFGDLCNSQCHTWCVNKTCDRGGCCTEGCENLNYGGCLCQEACNSNCQDGTCYQNKTCMEGCKLNYWRHDCNQVCSDSCTQGPDNSSSVCDWTGACVLGCKKTFMGPDCLGLCAINCLERDCNEITGHCLQGCVNGTWGDYCETNCSTNCRPTACNRNTGFCEYGCLTGFHGSFCLKLCPENCLNSTCFRENGTCSLGCTEGFTGEECDAKIQPSTPLPPDDYTVIYGTAGGAGAGLIALVLVFIFLRYRYVAYKEAAEVRDKNRKTVIEQGGLKKKRKERQSLAFGLVNPGFESYDGKTGADEDEEGVLNVETLMDFVIKTDLEEFAQEFMKLPANVSKPEKKRKNTYKASGRKVTFSDSDCPPHDNPAFDDSNALVIKENEVNLSAERTYNASSIEVYSRKYIAAEGPSSSTLLDFWMLIWTTASPLVVMLTPTSIIKQSSSVKYWPEHGKGEYGNITVTSVKEDTFANFVFRELKMERNGETRTIRQVQLSLWPDAKKLPNIADLLDFYIHFRAISENDTEPILVHCSDGEGRTGVFIAMDLLVRDGEQFGKICVLDCVKTLREQRDNMVQTKELYKFLYSIVAQTLQMRCKAVLEKDFVDFHQKSHQSLESNPLVSHIEDSYENMRAAVVMKPVDEESIKRQWNLKMKNREEADIPEDQYRPTLPGGAYINAVYIDTLRKKDLITTQMPLPKTIVDFYKLVATEKCQVIVMMNSLDTKDKTLGIYWPTKGRTMNHGNICVDLDEESETDNYKLMTLTFSDGSRKACCKNDLPEQQEHQVSFFQFTNWVSGPRPSDTSSILRLIQAVKTERDKYESGPVIVHCLNGSEKSGVFCALYELTDAIVRGLEISIINTAYTIKYRRPSAILNLDQFKFINEALDTFITNAEFRGEPVTDEIPLIIEDDEDD